jgi:hypothetical protein
MGRVQVFIADGFGLGLDTNLELAARLLDPGRVRPLRGFDQALVVLLWKFGIDREPDDLAVPAFGAGKFDGKLDPVGRTHLG